MLINNFKFDLDGTLINSYDAIVNNITRRGYQIVDDTQYKFEFVPQCSRDEIVEIIREGLAIGECQPCKGAVTLAHYAWAETKQPFSIITVRDSSIAEKTYKDAAVALDHFPMTIAMVKSFSDKIVHLSDVNCFIEDRRATAMSLAGKGKTVFMPSTIYNDLTDYTRDFPVMTHAQVPDYLPKLSESALFKTGRIIVIDSLLDLTDPKYKPLLFKEVIFDRVREILVPDEQI
jgi:hypothetical protein